MTWNILYWESHKWNIIGYHTSNIYSTKAIGGIFLHEKFKLHATLVAFLNGFIVVFRPRQISRWSTSCLIEGWLFWCITSCPLKDDNFGVLLHVSLKVDNFGVLLHASLKDDYFGVLPHAHWRMTILVYYFMPHWRMAILVYYFMSHWRMTILVYYFMSHWRMTIWCITSCLTEG